MTGAEKIQLMLDELRSIDFEEMPDDTRTIVASLQMMQGLGFDPFVLITPSDPAEVDVMLDKAISLLLQLRGDDIAPYAIPAGVRVVARQPDAEVI